MGVRISTVSVEEEEVITSRASVRFYGQRGCPYCQPTLDRIRAAHIPVQVVWCDTNPAQCPESIRTVPTVVFPGDVVVEGMLSQEQYIDLYARYAV